MSRILPIAPAVRARFRAPSAVLRLAAAVALIATAAPLHAQRTLDDIQRRFAQERDALIAQKEGRVTLEDVKKLARAHATLLAGFLQKDAKGSDAINGRLLLTNIYLDMGEEDDARETLQALDVEAAPAIELATAAEMAGVLGMQEQRDAWIQKALARPAPFEERMALGMFLMTRLVEVELGESVFEKALEDAADDEQRAKVLWYDAAAKREREDLGDGAFDEALEELAREYPKTYFGGVARDRLKALDLETGSDAIPLTGKTLEGEKITLSSFAGKVVLLWFWAPWSPPSLDVARRLVDLEARFGDQGLSILGVAIDEEKDAVRKAAKELGMTWPQLFDGRGWMTDAALRYGVEQPDDNFLIDGEGKIRAMHLYLLDERGFKDLEQAIESALRD